MKKSTLVVGVVLVAVLGGVYYRMTSGPVKSPSATATFSQGNLDIKVNYSRPSKRGRVIFGEKDSGALVPYGKYWRLGANAATEIIFAKNVTFAGQPVAAGSYRMYAIPSATSWKVVLNSQLSKWGVFEPKREKDVLSVDLPVETTPDKAEQFTISFAADPAGAKLDFSWDGALVRVPIAAAN